jgi:dTDP-4-dehydrorhamnose reductase
MSLEIWGGVECTLNRVKDRYFNQLIRSGHWQRPEDIQLFASLRLKTLRYPVLWESVAPEGDLTNADWNWTDERLNLLNENGIHPIAGLVHHGSGPLSTNLLDSEFADKLAEYARACAERYPWIENYTPVNEPLTTARFSALYGVWYPHVQDETSFWQALINQCRGIVLSMKEIRKVNPKARLVQTEDLGTIFSTPTLAYQAEYENIRRWLSFDLICGKVNSKHVLYKRLLKAASEIELGFFLENPCRPDIVGINYYVTSDRFLDDRLENYPRELYGGNGKDRYVDIESVRIPEAGIVGHKAALSAAWERYKIPVAVTEVHIDSTREDQLRWVWEAWTSANALKNEGAEVEAVTVWALLGSHDWNTLVTKDAGYYESGVFDLRAEKPRPTALSKMIKALSSTGEFEHPVLEHSGWWRRPCRSMNDKMRRSYESSVCEFSNKKARPVLITGGTGTLGRAFARTCEARGIAYKLLTRRDMDIADPESVEKKIKEFKPWAVINGAGYVRVDDAENDDERCYRENTLGAEILAKACNKNGISFLTFSTDLVFDGNRPIYDETAPVSPLNVYGRSKAEAERRVMEVCPSALIARTSGFFGPWDEYNFLTQALKSWSSGQAVVAAGDVIVTPTYVPDLVRVSLDLLIDEEKGIWHLTNHEPITWADFAARLAEMTGISQDLIHVRDMASLGQLAMRPKCSALVSKRGRLMPSLQSCLERYIREAEHDWMPILERV